ncbi:unnamed protein product, partial [Lymnaea stagnalis]
MDGFHSGLSRVPLLLPSDHQGHVIKSEAEFQAAMDSLGRSGDHMSLYHGGHGSGALVNS